MYKNYTFLSILFILDRLYALNINNVSLGGLINVKEPKPQYLRIDKGLDLRNVKFSKSLNALTLFCELNKIVFLLHNPINRYWEKINVSEQIVILDSNSKVHRMLNNVFTKNADVVIEAPVSAIFIRILCVLNALSIVDNI